MKSQIHFTGRLHSSASGKEHVDQTVYWTTVDVCLCLCKKAPVLENTFQSKLNEWFLIKGDVEKNWYGSKGVNNLCIRGQTYSVEFIEAVIKVSALGYGIGLPVRRRARMCYVLHSM